MNKAYPLKVILFANTDWYLYNFRRTLALALHEQGFELLLISPQGPYGERLRQLGLRWMEIPMERRSLNLLSELRLLWWLAALFRKERPTLVHGFTIKSAVYGSLAARISRVPARISAVAGMGYVFSSMDFKARALRPLVKMLLRLAMGGKGARLILQNPDDYSRFVEAGLSEPARTHLIPSSGVDCARFNSERGSRPTPEQPFRVVLAARLLGQKGIREYAAASRLLKQKGRRVTFLLAGTPDPGNPDSISESEVRAWIEEGIIEWLGHVDDMPALLDSCNAMALPSYYGEGVPRSLIEGGASGLALITTDMPGCRHAVEPDVTGLLIPARDSGALAEAIARLDRDRDLALRLGAAARERAVAEFDERIVIDKTIAVYRQLLKDNQQSS